MSEQHAHPGEANSENAATTPTPERTTVAPWIRLLSAFAAVAVLGFLGLLIYAFLTSESSGGRADGVRVNTVGSLKAMGDREAPNFMLTMLLTGEEIELTDFRGKIVVVNYWASWCPPCREEAAKLEQFHQTSDPEEVVLIGVSVWDKESDAKAFLEQYGKTYRNGIDEAGAIAIDYGVFGIPETFFIGPDGTLLARYAGPVESAQHIEEMTEELVESLQ